MNCGMECIKYILFIFNFFFALGGLAILVVGVLIHYQYTSYISDVLEVNVSFPATTLIIVGAVIFIIAFFGCCGAVRESHCMIITFAIVIMTLLVVQIAIAVFAFSNFKKADLDSSIEKTVELCIDNYYQKEEYRQAANTFQTLVKCCGYDSYTDYVKMPANQSIPYSCCGQPEGTVCIIGRSNIYPIGCKNQLPEQIEYYADMIGKTALVVAAIEVVGILFSLCLASAIRNDDRRAYKV